MLDDVRIRLAREADHAALLALWERSVRATHDFLLDADIVHYRPLVSEGLRGEVLELWVLTNESDVPLGFMGLAGDQIEALFLEPESRRCGGGRRLVAHAQMLRGGALMLDVNEQNGQARAFYETLGFTIIGRSPVDSTGRPYPLLHLRRPAPAEATSLASPVH
jgi:putative acetyltransferase